MPSHFHKDARRTSLERTEQYSTDLSSFQALLLKAIDHVSMELDLPLHEADPIREVGQRTLSGLPHAYEQILDLSNDKLYASRYDEVPLRWVRLYEEAQLYAIKDMRNTYKGLLCEMQDHGIDIGKIHLAERCLTEIVKRLDMALIKTQGIGRKPLIQRTLEVVNVFSYERPDENSDDDSDDAFLTFPGEWDDLAPEDEEAFLGLRQRTDHAAGSRPSQQWVGSYLIPQSVSLKFTSTTGTHVQTLKPACGVRRLPEARDMAASLRDFEIHRTDDNQPAIIPQGIRDWPAMKLWRDPYYWLRNTHGGRRLVPIEIGSKYTDAEWTQKIVDFKTLVLTYLDTHSKSDDRPDDQMMTTEDMHTVGYLAQHEFFDQMPTFHKDIRVPEFCYVRPCQDRATRTTKERGGLTLKRKRASPSGEQLEGDSPAPQPRTASATETYEEPLNDSLNKDEASESGDSEMKINIWLGPAHTISPAHTDPHHNVLCQVMGRKYVRLFAPTESDRMYPIASIDKGGAEGGEESCTVKHDDGTGSSPLREYVYRQHVLEDIDTSTQWSDAPVFGPTLTNTAQSTETSHSIDMSNTSQLDVSLEVDWDSETADKAHDRRQKRNEQHQKFPNHAHAEFQECVLEAGDCLFIPRGWWHYVQSLDVSASVSFWWDE